jgi:pimeloyl-ACP methyl ester carboxylesterase
MPVANIRGLNIVYQIVGDAGPFIALTTGGRRGHAEFIPLARKIAANDYRVVLHDRRNTGASDILIEGEESEEEIWADDLYLLLKSLGVLPAFIGGSSSGSRMSILLYLRHPEAVRALLLLRVTGGAFAAKRLPENYYATFIRAAQQGGMAAVCATDQYQERIAANPANRERLINLDPAKYIAAMSHWHQLFLDGANLPVMGVTDNELHSIKIPTLIIPGNDKVHASASARAAQSAIPGAVLHQLPIADQDIPLIPFDQWALYEDEIADVFCDFMSQCAAQETTT